MRDTLVATLNNVHQSASTLSLGLRWDFHSRAALKLQWDRTRIDAYGYEPWAVTVDQIGRPARVGVFSASVDFFF